MCESLVLVCVPAIVAGLFIYTLEYGYGSLCSMYSVGASLLNSTIPGCESQGGS